MKPHEILSRYWGYSRFRPLQEEIILSVLGGNDTLALMPTGGGKSLCFQVPAMSQEGICIVVSPLIALMRDQVENLAARDIKAIAVISGMSKREVDIALDNCVYGDIKFLYLSPERLLSDLVRERIRHMNVNLIAVDEAHCISHWGYDFRPPYLEISKLRELHPKIPILALTATATDTVAADIRSKLEFRGGKIFRMSFERKNLTYLVYNEENKIGKLLKIASGVEGSGIVYVRNRRETQEVARQLNMNGISAEYYHAGLSGETRLEKQSLWKTSGVRVMVATNAFGMGIDKPDVRFVVHLDLPESLEAYYQEAGRAGRDEKKAFAVLLYNQADHGRLKKRLEQSYPTVEEIVATYHHLGNYFQLAYGAGEGVSMEFDLAEFAKRFSLEPLKALSALKFLEHDGYIHLSESVYIPSRLRIAASTEDIYRFQVLHPAYDRLFRVLLRSYGGLYDRFVNIRESDVAKRAGMKTAEVVAHLNKLHELELVIYARQTDKPLITYLRQRFDTAHLAIDAKYIVERFENASRQIQAVIRYTANDVCRSVQLLQYFGEETTEDCGNCDICISKRRDENLMERNARIIQLFIEELTRGPRSLTALVDAVTVGTDSDKLELLRKLLDAGKVKSNGDILYLPGE